MKAALLTTPGIANLAITEMAEPEPGPGEVKVRIRASSLNYRDLITVEGGYGSKQKQDGLIPLSDGAGEVAAVGAGVTAFQPGDRVTPIFFSDWLGGEPTAQGWAARWGDRRRAVQRNSSAFRNMDWCGRRPSCPTRRPPARSAPG